jgi:hypothetical protein
VTFAFGLYVYGDECQTLAECLDSLRAAYPKSALVILHDGPISLHAGAGVRQEYETLAERYQGIFAETPARCRRMPFGGFWLQRLLKETWQASRGRAEWIVKLDPDTRVTRPVSMMPDADLCGYLRVRVDMRRFPIVTEHFCTAAWVAIRQSVARRLGFARMPLGGEAYQDGWYNQSAHYIESDGLCIGSWILHDAAKSLGATVARHPEVHLQWREDVPAELWTRYAVVNVETRGQARRVSQISA